jgi:peptidyl-prolyl cis-trans isomerase C
MKQITSGLLLAAFLSTPSAQLFAEDTQEAVLATVNGSPITQEMYDAYASKRNTQTQGGAAPASTETVLNELINVELVMQDAEKKGIDQRPEIQKQMEWQRRSLLVTAGMRDYLDAHPITDEELKKAYDTEIAKLDKTEYKARHILLETEAEANEVIAQLDKGTDFAELAKEKSKGPTGKQGGDLGWFSPARMVKPFSDAVATLEKGNYTEKPVQTQFGWHVILLEDTRDLTPPAFDQVKDQLQPGLQKQRVDQYLDELRKTAKIDTKQ